MSKEGEITIDVYIHKPGEEPLSSSNLAELIRNARETINSQKNKAKEFILTCILHSKKEEQQV